MNGTIEVLVSPEGDVTLKTSGFQGSDCLEASRFLEASLGDVVSDRKTPEFYQVERQQEHLQNR
jgi:hypothetical protein